MRLTCPNCDAQYEVPDEVIPPEGRDVQCSNCGHPWFQPPAGEALDADEGDAEDGFAPDAAPAPEEDTSESPDQSDEQDDWDEDGELPDDKDEDSFDNDPAPTDPVQGRGVGPDVSDILREEAAREAELRAREAEALESQPDLGLDAYPGDEPGRRAREAQDRMARMRGQEPVAQETDSTSRRGLLPDIEEINSTLRNSDAAAAAPAIHAGPARRRRSGGFMRGFVVMLIFGAVLFLLYTNAPLVARTLPQADPMLSAYVALVDQARLWLDAQIGALIPR